MAGSVESKRVKEGNDLFRPRCARPPSPEGEGKGAGREKRLIAPRTTLPDMAAETWRDELAPAWHFAEGIARVDRMIAEEEAIGPYPNRDRFLNHLRGTREVLIDYYERRLANREQGAGSRE